jgi:hypothetical protein
LICPTSFSYQYLKVAEEYFQLQSHMFSSRSEKAKELLSTRMHHPEHVVVLEGVTPTEFENFLTAIYCKYVILLTDFSLP